MRTLAAIGRTLGPALAWKKIIVGAEDSGVLTHLAACYLPLAAPHADRDLELVGRAHLFAVLETPLYFRRERDVVNVEYAVHAQRTKQESSEVLVAFLGVHDAVIARVAAVHEGAR